MRIGGFSLPAPYWPWREQTTACPAEQAKKKPLTWAAQTDFLVWVPPSTTALPGTYDLLLSQGTHDSTTFHPQPFPVWKNTWMAILLRVQPAYLSSLLAQQPEIRERSSPGIPLLITESKPLEDPDHGSHLRMASRLCSEPSPARCELSAGSAL